MLLVRQEKTPLLWSNSGALEKINEWCKVVNVTVLSTTIKIDTPDDNFGRDDKSRATKMKLVSFENSCYTNLADNKEIIKRDKWESKEKNFNVSFWTSVYGTCFHGCLSQSYDEKRSFLSPHGISWQTTILNFQTLL